MEENWYLHRGGKQLGPIAWGKLWGMAREGQLKGEEKVWRQGMATWTPAAQIPGLFSSSWYVARGGSKRGPMSWEQLYSEAREGKVAGEDLVWGEGCSEWQPAGEVPGLLARVFGLADGEKRVSLLTLASAETSVLLFGRREGQWQEESPDRPARPCSEQEVKAQVLGKISTNLSASAGLHACLTVEEAVVFKAVTTLTWLLGEKLPAAAFCSAEDIGRWLEAGEHVQAMLLLGGDMRVAGKDHDIPRGLAGLARHGLVKLWDGQLAMLTDQGRSLGRFLVAADRIHALSVTEKVAGQVLFTELCFSGWGNEVLFTRPWQGQVLAWSVEKTQVLQVLEHVWQKGERAMAFAELDEILGRGGH